MPKDATPFGLKLDLNAEALLAPVCGTVVPFHVRTVKNMSKSVVDRTHFLRVNFFTPGQGKSEADYPVVKGNRLYVRELCFRSQSQANFDKGMREFKEAQKRTRQRDLEGECKSTTAEVGSLQCLRAPPCLRDLHVRPSLSTGRRCVGTLEAHANGFRFSARGGADKIDILYSQVKHAIFEACDNTPLVLIHLHFVEPLILGKKKSQDVQFFAEAIPFGIFGRPGKTNTIEELDSVLCQLIRIVQIARVSDPGIQLLVLARTCGYREVLKFFMKCTEFVEVFCPILVVNG